ncbi:hypothetical protein ACHAWF_001643, partial [Thalassiosira exigua]
LSFKCVADDQRNDIGVREGKDVYDENNRTETTTAPRTSRRKTETSTSTMRSTTRGPARPYEWEGDNAVDLSTNAGGTAGSGVDAAAGADLAFRDGACRSLSTLSIVDAVARADLAFHDGARRSLSVPQHVTFVCDGNSRWLRAKNLPEAAGHAAGAERVVELIKRLGREYGGERGGGGRVSCVTLFAFSTKNWFCPRLEIDALFRLMECAAERYRHHPVVKEGRVCFKVLGNLDDERIPMGAPRALEAAGERAEARDEEAREEAAAAGARGASRGDAPRRDKALTVCLAINCGGRANLLRAARHLVQSTSSGDLSLSDLDESTLSKHL